MEGQSFVVKSEDSIRPSPGGRRPLGHLLEPNKTLGRLPNRGQHWFVKDALGRRGSGSSAFTTPLTSDRMLVHKKEPSEFGGWPTEGSRGWPTEGGK